MLKDAGIESTFADYERNNGLYSSAELENPSSQFKYYQDMEAELSRGFPTIFMIH